MSCLRKLKRSRQLKEKKAIKHSLVKDGKKVVIENGKLKIVDVPKPHRKEN